MKSLKLPLQTLQQMKSNTIKLAVVGDQSVGKTSLVCAIISDLPNELPKVHKKVVLPPDMCPYSKDIFTEVIDTGPDPRLEMRQADLILLIYDVSDSQSVMRLKQHWLPIINAMTRELGREVPVVIVGNKSDKIQLPMDDQLQYTSVKQVLKTLVRTYKQVQMGIQCSAFYDRNIKKVLNSAQRAVLYPLAPLYDINLKTITPKFRKALLRIFRILDSEFRGNLNDSDLISLQQRVFQSELNGEDIRAIKNIIQKECEQQQSATITVKGFIAFQKKCIQMLKIQLCWSILRHFDYNHDLQINLNNDSFVIHFQQGEALELSAHALQFLQNIYTFSHKTALQNESPIQKLFEPAPRIPLQQFKAHNLSLQRFIYIWHQFTVIDYRQCYRSLLYIGYDRKLDQCFNILRGKTRYSDLLKIKERQTYNVLFIEDEQHSVYLQSLFTQGAQQGLLARNVMLFSDKKWSKVINLFKVKDRNLRQLVAQNDIVQRIDIVVYFSGHMLSARLLNELIPSYVMRKEITKQISQNIIKFNLVPELNLESFPVSLKQGPQDRLVKYLISLFEKIQEAYPIEYLNALQKEQNKMKNIFITIASGAAIVILSFLGFQHKRRSK